MTKNPYLNAFIASLYIIVLVLLFSLGQSFAKDHPDTILAPMAMLSMLVLSVAFMGYTFFAQPVLMYLDGQKREALQFFTKTLVTFAGVTAVIVVVAFSL